MKSILDKIEIDDLPNDTLKALTSIIGINTLKELIVKIPGAKIYIPNSVKSISNKAYAIKNFKGNNHQEIADHLDVTKRSVYRMVKV